MTAAVIAAEGRRAGALQRKPEWSYQLLLVRFLNAAVAHPREIRAFDKAGAQRSVGAWSAAVARGVKDGTADVLVIQGTPLVAVWIECKSAKGTERPAQTSTASAYALCGVSTVSKCQTIRQALDGLRAAGVRLHGNADNLAVEYQERVAASERERASGVVKKRSGKPRVRESRSKTMRWAKIQAGLV